MSIPATAPRFETARLVLDALREDDIDRVHEYCSDPIFERFMTTPWPYTRRDAEYFVRSVAPSWWAAGAEATWAVRRTDGGGFAGIVGIRTSTGSIGFWLGAAHRGLGIMPEAAAAVIAWHGARSDLPVRWECVAGNTASAAVARKLGFSYVGEHPTALAFRDGTHPLSWHGVRSPDGGPVEGAAPWPERSYA